MQIIHYPDQVLKRQSKPVREVDRDVLDRAHQMLELMYESDGIGLAAPQVGWSRRIITLDVDQDRKGERIFINPRIIEREGTAEGEEGCLSLPGMSLAVPRAERVTVAAYTPKGERVEIEADGLHAAAWQHELDHLDGLLIINRADPASVLAVNHQLRKLEREARKNS
jgi:peptide deformylase